MSVDGVVGDGPEPVDSVQGSDAVPGAEAVPATGALPAEVPEAVLTDPAASGEVRGADAVSDTTPVTGVESAPGAVVPSAETLPSEGAPTGEAVAPEGVPSAEGLAPEGTPMGEALAAESVPLADAAAPETTAAEAEAAVEAHGVAEADAAAAAVQPAEPLAPPAVPSEAAPTPDAAAPETLPPAAPGEADAVEGAAAAQEPAVTPEPTLAPAEAPAAPEPEATAPDAAAAVPLPAEADQAPQPVATAPAETEAEVEPEAGTGPEADAQAESAAHPESGATPTLTEPPLADQPQEPTPEEAPVQDPEFAQPAAAQGPTPGESAPQPLAAEAGGIAVEQSEPSAEEAEEAEAPAPPVEPLAADAPATVLPAGVPLEPQPGLPVGEFVPVDGTVPTTPHLAPTPPHPMTFPADDVAQPVVPGPRDAAADAEPDLVQHADDLDTQGAEQEDDDVSQAPAEDVRQSSGPAAPPYDDAEREAVLKVMRERRDIRNGFRSDPIPHEVLLRVLEAAHTAPSVGHSQPWDFVVIRSAETRGAMHELAQRQRDAYAKSLPKGRAKQFKELKIEAILDTPVNIVVTADPTRGGRHTLGRHTQPQMAPYSAALAVENLWLAARAEGLGVGWVSFFDEREMVRALGLPEHLEVIAYLCVGYVDEFPDEPELMQAGWSKRRPLSWVVHEETYGRRALPGEEPHDLLAETVAQIRPLDAKALGEAWERQKRMTKPAGALGMLEIISAQLSGLSRQCPPPIPEPAAVAIFAGDHGVHAQGVTPWPQEVTAQMVANFLGGGAVCNAFAGQVGAEVCVVDVGVAADLPATPGLLPRKIRAGTSDMTTGPAMTREEAKQAIEVGIETARDLVAAGNKALLTGEMGIANTTASAALISVFTGADPAEVTGRGTGINDETLARKTEVVRRAIEVHQPDPADPIGVLAAIGGFEHAAIVGLLLGGASLRTPVILDGVSAGAAALVARAIAPEVLAACIAGHRSAEPGHVAALNKLGLRPLVDLDLRLGEGTGALLALPLVQSTARAMHEVATFDSAGVTEK
ncbi:nicotinate-nucleotide--dimethylbenzimidazole phosphoribosyltransferase [Streptomyces sp. NPDC047072]|uniref:nicotinate-nucleotide--dimethylbenzimidazole phosphoribosyltransferase n=1 Tax=Streptomyces sp. NPDC047072 TaxID=3154809 RepID=UPI0033E28FC8